LRSSFVPKDILQGGPVQWGWISIDWPAEPQEMSDKDGKWPDLDRKFHGLDLMRSLA
jgi:hypothetical protein